MTVSLTETRPRLLAAALLVASCIFLGCSSSSKPTVKTASGKIDISQATYVGREGCVACHKAEAEKFAHSHHDDAMQPATEATVLADFDDATLEHYGIVSRMFRDGQRFMVHTQGPDGAMQDFEVKYVFGVEPLQQYMVEIPGEEQNLEDGALPRVQVLRISWDTEKKKWFFLSPPDVREALVPADDLHWTGIAQRWNTMCAECHSTNYQKNFTVPESHTQFVSKMASEGQSAESRLDVSKAVPPGDYQSTFFEIDVSCEACHGPGSVHVELANQWFPGWSRERGFGLADLKATAENQIQACAPCHSRRNVIDGTFTAGDNFYDFYSNQFLTADIYYPDGQILDEDYVHGSFIQSKMYHKGIRCSDCHDPHSAKLKHDGNAVCTSCHQHPAAKYDSVAHHFHKVDGEGAKCVNCHMPATTYMDVDARRDHSLRIPRPDLSTKLGTPNACTGCHLEKKNVAPEKLDSLRLYQDWMAAARDGDEEVLAEIERANAWCDAACEKWYGEKRQKPTHFGEAIHAAQTGATDAISQVEELLGTSGPAAPAIARATALVELSNFHPQEAARLAEVAISDASPLVREAATRVLPAHLSPRKAVNLLEAALDDKRRIVRTSAARNLLNLPRQLFTAKSSAALRKALKEMSDGLQFSADRSGAHLSLGILAELQGRQAQAIKHYRDAVAVEPLVTGPRTNLAALLEQNLRSPGLSPTAREETVGQVQTLRREELQLLQRDADLLPSSAAIQYRLGLSLYLNRELVDGAMEQAEERLLKAAEIDGGNPQFAQAAAMILDANEKYAEALKWAENALELSGGDQQYRMLRDEIRQKVPSVNQ